MLQDLGSDHLQILLSVPLFFDCTLSFSKHVFLLKAKFVSCLKALCCISASSWGPSKESLSLLYKSFLWPLLTYASPGWFSFLIIINITKLECLHQAASCTITSCLLSSPIPLLFSEASLPPLQVTLTHFTLSSYKRALCLPTSFPISGLARLEAKPILCRSFWRAFASTHLLMLPSCLSFLLGTCLSSPWSPPFPLCFFSDLPLSRQDLALAHLDSLPPYDLVLWTDSFVLFLFGKGSSGVFANSLCGTQQAQYAQVFLLKPAPFCKLFAGLGSTNKSATSLLLLSDSCSVLTTLSSLLSFLCLKLSGGSGRNCLYSPPVLSDYNGCPDTHFSWGTMQLMNRPDKEHYLHLCNPLLSLSFCLSYPLSSFLGLKT